MMTTTATTTIRASAFHPQQQGLKLMQDAPCISHRDCFSVPSTTTRIETGLLFGLSGFFCDASEFHPQQQGLKPRYGKSIRDLTRGFSVPSTTTRIETYESRAPEWVPAGASAFHPQQQGLKLINITLCVMKDCSASAFHPQQQGLKLRKATGRIRPDSGFSVPSTTTRIETMLRNRSRLQCDPLQRSIHNNKD